MVLYCRDGQTHLRCHIRYRISLNPSKNECALLLCGQLFHKLFQSPQLVSGIEHAIVADRSAQIFQIGHIVKRDDGIPASLVDQQVACDPMHERKSIADLAPVLDGISAGENFSEYVIEIDMLRQDPAQPAAHQPLAGQDYFLKPSDFL